MIFFISFLLVRFSFLLRTNRGIFSQKKKKRKKKVSLMGVGGNEERGMRDGRACGSFLDLGIIVGKKMMG